jgi:lipopolysaccharide/colanic/teichoic acid biosynthesis glycosyltransferase
VLKGEMSIVGPRPEDIEIVERYFTAEQRRILEVRPGLTCLTQVRNFPDMTGEVPPGVDAQAYYVEKQLPRRLAEDLEYIERASLKLDLELFVRTAYSIVVKSWFVLGRTSARKVGKGRERCQDAASS